MAVWCASVVGENVINNILSYLFETGLNLEDRIHQKPVRYVV